jgi:hypothetical protein
MGRRDGFREATVIAVTVFGVGASVVHIFSDALLIAFLAASRRVERSPDPELTHQHSIDGAVRGYVQLA